MINQCLSMLTSLSDPLLVRRSMAEKEVIKIIRTKYANKTFGIPFIAEKNLLPALLDSLKKNLNIK